MPIQITAEWWQATNSQFGTRWFRSNTLAILWMIAPLSIDPHARYWWTEKDPSGGAPGSS